MLLACPNCATTYEVKAAVIGDSGHSLRCARCHRVWFATRAQELVFTAQPVEATAIVEPASFDSPPSAPSAEGATAAPPVAPEPPIFSETAQPAGRPEIFDASIEAPPIAPNLTASPSHVALSAEGEDIETFAQRQAQLASSRAQRLRAQFGPPAFILLLSLCIMALVAWRTSIVRFAPQTASFYAAIGLPVNLREFVFSNVKTSKETRDGVPTLVVEGAIVSTAKYPVEVPRLRFSLRNASGQEIYSWTTKPDQTVLAPGAELPFRSRLASPPREGHEVVVRFLNRRDATDAPR